MGEGEICKVELVRKGDVRVFFASSSEVYGDAEVFPTPEFYEGKVDPLGPRSCYEEGKRFGEALCKEMLPFFAGGKNGELCLKPIVQLVFEQLYQVGFREFCFIVGRGKRAIEDYFTPDFSTSQCSIVGVRTVPLSIWKPSTRWYCWRIIRRLYWLTVKGPSPTPVKFVFGYAVGGGGDRSPVGAVTADLMG